MQQITGDQNLQVLFDIAESAVRQKPLYELMSSAIEKMPLAQLHAFKQFKQLVHDERPLLRALKETGWADARGSWQSEPTNGVKAHEVRQKLVDRTLALVHEILPGAIQPESWGSSGFESDIDITFCPAPGQTLRTAMLGKFVFDSLIYGACKDTPSHLLDTQILPPHGGATDSAERALTTDAGRSAWVRLELDAVLLHGHQTLKSKTWCKLRDELMYPLSEPLSSAAGKSARSIFECKPNHSPARQMAVCRRIDELGPAATDEEQLTRLRAHLELTASVAGSYFAQGTCNFAIESRSGQKLQRRRETVAVQHQQQRRASLPDAFEPKPSTRKYSLESKVGTIGTIRSVLFSSAEQLSTSLSPRNASPRNASPRNASPRNASPRTMSPRTEAVAFHPPKREQQPATVQECAFAMLENLVTYMSHRSSDRGTEIARAVRHSKYAERALLAARQLVLRAPTLAGYREELDRLLVVYSELEIVKRARRLNAKAATTLLRLKTNQDLSDVVEDALPLKPYGKHGEESYESDSIYLSLMSKLPAALARAGIEGKVEVVDPKGKSEEAPDALPFTRPATVGKILQAVAGLPVEEYRLQDVIREGAAITRADYPREMMEEYNQRLRRLVIATFRQALSDGVVMAPDTSERDLFDA